MNKITKNVLIGVAFGYLGMIMYCVMLKGVDNIYLEDVVDLFKQALVPYLLTTFASAVLIEGLSNLKKSFDNLVTKLNRKVTKNQGA